MITKKPYEEYFRYHNFKRKSAGGCLNDDETIESAIVLVVSANDEDDEYPEMVGTVSVWNGTYVVYWLKGGEKGKKYEIKVRIVTSNNQKFENDKPIELVVI